MILVGYISISYLVLESPYLVLSHLTVALASHTIIILIFALHPSFLHASGASEPRAGTRLL